MWLKGGQLSLAETLPQKSVWVRDERRPVATSPALGPQGQDAEARAGLQQGADRQGSGCTGFRHSVGDLTSRSPAA